jgi:hypothetical protein
MVPALRAIGNLLTGEDFVCQSLLDLGVLDVLAPLLNSSKKSIRREACWSFSNICGGSPSQVEQVISSHTIMERLLDIASDDVREVRKEARWCLTNMCDGASLYRIGRLLSYKSFISVVCQILHENDVHLAQAASSALKLCLKFGEMLAQLSGDDTNPISGLIHSNAINPHNGVFSVFVAEDILTHHMKCD